MLEKLPYHYLGVPLALLLVIVVLVVADIQPPSFTDSPEVKILKERKIIEYTEPTEAVADGTVQYSYLGEELPEKLSETEDVNKRTESSYHSLIGREKINETSERLDYKGTFYSGRAFAKDSGRWYVREFATTTESAFNEALNTNAFAFLSARKVQASVFSGFSGSGDGRGRYDESDGSGACNFSVNSPLLLSTVNATESASLTTSLALGTFCIEMTCSVRRVFVPFDTSSIPVSTAISSATLTMNPTAKTNLDDDGFDYVVVVETYQADHTSLSSGDDMGSTELSTPVDLGTIVATTNFAFTLNSTGRASIKRSGQASACSATPGITCLGIRTGHELNDLTISPVGCPGARGESVTFSLSETAGTADDPTLDITYAVVQPFVFWQFQDF